MTKMASDFIIVRISLDKTLHYLGFKKFKILLQKKNSVIKVSNNLNVNLIFIIIFILIIYHTLC